MKTDDRKRYEGTHNGGHARSGTSCQPLCDKHKEQARYG